MDNRCIIIAEAGVNHNGDINLAYQLIDVAKRAGADYVKFQTFDSAKLVAEETPRAQYQAKNIGGAEETQLQMLRKLELPFEDYPKLEAYCKKAGIGFMSTPHEVDALRFLVSRTDMDYLKVASGDLRNILMLRELCKIRKPVILSTGMSTLGEIESAIKALEKGGLGPDLVIILHCTTDYPTPIKEANLRVMDTLAHAFPGYKIGYSDHTPGIEVAQIAVSQGACMIEKHFTLDRKMAGPDHAASLVESELAELVRTVHNKQELDQLVSANPNRSLALGNGRKVMTDAEAANREIAGKSIGTTRDIRAGDILNADNLTVKRFGVEGLDSVLWWDQVEGSVAACDIPRGTALQLGDIRSKGAAAKC